MNTSLRDFVKENPDMPVAEVCAKFNCSKQNVYIARYDAGVTKPNLKLRAKPAKPGLKTVRNQTLLSKERKIKELSERVAELTDQLDMMKTSPNQKSEVLYIPTPDQLSLIPKLEKDLVAANAIIAYLEGKLYGSPV